MYTERDKIANLIGNIEIEKEAAAGLITKIPGLISGARHSPAVQNVKNKVVGFATNQKAKAQQWGNAIAADWKNTAGQTNWKRMNSALDTSMVVNPKGTVGALVGTGVATGVAANSLISGKKKNEYVSMAPGSMMIKSAEIQPDLEKFAENMIKDIKADPLNALTAATIGGVGVGVGIASRNKIKAFNARNARIADETSGLREFGSLAGEKYQHATAKIKSEYDDIFKDIIDPHTKKAVKSNYDDIVRTLEETKKKTPYNEIKDMNKLFNAKLDDLLVENKVNKSVIDALRIKVDALYK